MDEVSETELLYEYENSTSLSTINPALLMRPISHNDLKISPGRASNPRWAGQDSDEESPSSSSSYRSTPEVEEGEILQPSPPNEVTELRKQLTELRTQLEKERKQHTYDLENQRQELLDVLSERMAEVQRDCNEQVRYAEEEVKVLKERVQKRDQKKSSKSRKSQVNREESRKVEAIPSDITIPRQILELPISGKGGLQELLYTAQFDLEYKAVEVRLYKERNAELEGEISELKIELEMPKTSYSETSTLNNLPPLEVPEAFKTHSFPTNTSEDKAVQVGQGDTCQECAALSQKVRENCLEVGHLEYELAMEQGHQSLLRRAAEVERRERLVAVMEYHAEKARRCEAEEEAVMLSKNLKELGPFVPAMSEAFRKLTEAGINFESAKPVEDEVQGERMDVDETRRTEFELNI